VAKGQKQKTDMKLEQNSPLAEERAASMVLRAKMQPVCIVELLPFPPCHLVQLGGFGLTDLLQPALSRQAGRAQGGHAMGQTVTSVKFASGARLRN
jgi:hypothetical protein